MDVKVDTKKLINLRNNNAWSQQHLADTAGISLRTVQRIESKGVSSKESLLALASAFELTPTDLILRRNQAWWARKAMVYYLSSAVVVFAAIVYVLQYSADNITMAVQADYNGDTFADVRFSGELGVVSEYALHDKLLLSVLPNITNGHLVLEMKVFEMQPSGEFELVSSPNVWAEYGKPVAIRATVDGGAEYGVVITPQG